MNIKSVWALLLSAAIIALGAMLPMFVANRQDAANENHVLIASVKDVQLTFTQDAMTISQTVALLGSYREAIEIPQSLTALKQDKAKAIAHAAIERYQQAGVFFQDTAEQGQFFSCQPFLMYGDDASDSGSAQNNIYWSVNYGDADGTFTFYLFIDDQTGTVCSVEYSDNKHKYKQADMEFILSSFCSLYLSDLGEEFYWCEPSDIFSQTKSPPDGSYLAADFTWSDATHAAYTITFFVNESSFYTNIHPSNQAVSEKSKKLY